MLMASTLGKQCFLCNLKEIGGNCLVDSHESSLILFEVLNVPHLMNDLKKLEHIFYCHPCKKRILKVHESLKILKKLEKQVLEEKYSIELQLETNYDVGYEMYSSSYDFGVELVNEMRFISIKSKLNKLVKTQIDRKFSKAKKYRIMKNITITEELKHGTIEGHISKETTPLIYNIISTEKQPFIKDNILVPSNNYCVDSATNLQFHQAELPLTSHVYDFEDIKLDLRSEDTNNTTEIKDPFEGIVPESSFVTEGSTTQKMFICGICETNFHEYIQLDEHCRSHHTVEKPFKCSYCEKTFYWPNLVKLHERIHTGEKPFKCSYCKKPFSLRQNVKSHERIHTGEKPFKCKFCEKFFSEKSNMKIHEYIHTGEKPFKCGYCDKTFRDPNNRRSHELIHRTVKPFKCNFCEEYFSRKSRMEVHERIHTVRKLFKCGYCDKTFRDYRNTKRHERIHTGEKPFKCEYCDKTFRQQGNMKRHELIHKGKPFKCGYCDKTFRDNSNMKQHECIHIQERPLNID